MPREAPPPLLSHGNGPLARPARCPSRGRRQARPPAAPRASDKSGEQCARPKGGPAAGPGTRPRDTKGPACLGRRGAGGGDRREACGPDGTAATRPRPQPRASTARGPERPTAGSGVSKEELRPEDKERVRREPRSGGWGRARGELRVPGIGCGGLGGLGLGRSKHHQAGRGAVRGPGGGPPPPPEASGAWGQLCPKGYSPQLRPAGQLPWQRGRGWGGV